MSILKLNERPKATLHSFGHAFNNYLRDEGVDIKDRQVLMAHSSSETTTIYTHPNFDLALSLGNRLPILDRREDDSN